MVFLGYLIRVENWRDLGRAQVFSPQAHQNLVFLIWGDYRKEEEKEMSK